MVECLPLKCKDLSSVLSFEKNNNYNVKNERNEKNNNFSDLKHMQGKSLDTLKIQRQPGWWGGMPLVPTRESEAGGSL